MLMAQPCQWNSYITWCTLQTINDASYITYITRVASKTPQARLPSPNRNQQHPQGITQPSVTP